MQPPDLSDTFEKRGGGINISPHRCSSKRDPITQLEWVEDEPDLFINFINDPNKPTILVCYNADSLRQYIDDPDNKFARWDRSDQYMKIDPRTGAYGAPNHNVPYVRFYTDESGDVQYIIDDDFVDQIRKGLKNVIFDARFIGKERIGNWTGVAGRSAIHGRDMDIMRIYRLENPRYVNTRGKKKSRLYPGWQRRN